MTFDEQLQRSLGMLADRLRDDIARACQDVGQVVGAHANEARAAAAQDASSRAREEVEAAARQEIAKLERRVEGIAAAAERLVDALHLIDRAASLSEILDALVLGASREASRVGVFVARQGDLRAWRFIGFDAVLEPKRSVRVRAEEAGVVGEAARAGVTVSSPGSGTCLAPAFAALPADRPCLAVPVMVSGDVAAVLYADQGAADDERRPYAIKWPDALELFARYAARCLEAATAIRAVRALTDPPEISARAVPAVGTGAAVSAEAVPAAASSRETNGTELRVSS
jgi:hypothetical protein